jgi:hypothetical protein
MALDFLLRELECFLHPLSLKVTESDSINIIHKTKTEND